jgi:hypothetical protein
MAVMGTAAAKLPPVGCSLLPRTAAPEQTKSQNLQPGAAGPAGSTGREKCVGKQIAARPLSVDFGHNVEQHRHERCRRRNEIDRLFRRLKGFRRIFSRFDKLDLVFLGFLHFALIVEALRYLISINTP